MPDCLYEIIIVMSADELVIFRNRFKKGQGQVSKLDFFNRFLYEIYFNGMSYKLVTRRIRLVTEVSPAFGRRSYPE